MEEEAFQFSSEMATETMTTEASTMELQEVETTLIPSWLEHMLQKTFFGACNSHGENAKNELNRYCITCDIEACRYCIDENHKEHKLLQIYRHVYQDVVTLTDIQTQINCSKIQPYKCNKKWIIALNPLPHCGSGSQIDEELSCVICKRKLMDPDLYRYCCIACKAEACGVVVAENRAKESDEEREERRKRRRKGIPVRAPFS